MNTFEGKYQGRFVNNLLEGPGSCKFKDGGEYTGDFKSSIIQGQGRMIYLDGTEYTGQWKNNQRDGLGITKAQTGASSNQKKFKNS